MAEINSLEDLGAAMNTQDADGAAPAETVPAAPDAPVHERKVDEHNRAYATGKRKDAIARVWLQPGSGRILVKGATKSRDVKKKLLVLTLRRTRLPMAKMWAMPTLKKSTTTIARALKA